MVQKGPNFVYVYIEWPPSFYGAKLGKQRVSVLKVYFKFSKKVALITLNTHGKPTLISLINVGSTLTDFEKFHPPQKKSTLHVY